ncbi:MAG: FkbM family methyltransferase [Arenimonas sp.]|uniref:FkbM family methyltransferase n=1 Tax=Arenimonas sp. TaxID=1872635 RepID=UPI0025B9AA0F|nr:FkbM family methyltransferase [Arenimonas sp.]MBW8368910.1 FkbM family methyltransferase [Arenimonas sp.]
MASILPVSIGRRVVERMLASLTVVRRLPPGAGASRLVATPRVGGLKYLFKPATLWDPELLRIAGLLVRPGGSVWDVGANVGLFSLAARHHAGREGCVVAIEADLDAALLLFRTARLNEGSFTVLPIAVYGQDGFVRFNIARRARASNAIEGFGSSQTGGVLEVRTLPAYRLDSLLEHFTPPTVLKIDVEGAEMDVLRGAVRTLTEHRPAIYCEVTADTRRAAVAFLEASGYSTFDGDSFDTSSQSSVGDSTSNLVAIPHD